MTNRKMFFVDSWESAVAQASQFVSDYIALIPFPDANSRAVVETVAKPLVVEMVALYLASRQGEPGSWTPVTSKEMGTVIELTVATVRELALKISDPKFSALALVHGTDGRKN